MKLTVKGKLKQNFALIQNLFEAICMGGKGEGKVGGSSISAIGSLAQTVSGYL